MMRPFTWAWTLLRSALAGNLPLRWAIYWQLVLLAAGTLAMPFDRRLILGLNPWIKPMKFELSVIIFLVTVLLLLYGLRHRVDEDHEAYGRSRAWLSWGFALAMTVENTAIALQSLRGVPSHMNYTSLFNGVLFGVMGVFILVNTVFVAWLLALWCVARVPTPAGVTWGVRLGLFMLLAGSVEGGMMVAHGAHTVGAKDGLAGLSFVNWSVGHGDLRVAHFFALHALQILPLAALLLSRTSLSRRLQVAGVWLFAAMYAGGVWLLFAEAMHGRPLLAR